MPGGHIQGGAGAGGAGGGDDGGAGGGAGVSCVCYGDGRCFFFLLMVVFDLYILTFCMSACIRVVLLPADGALSHTLRLIAGCIGCISCIGCIGIWIVHFFSVDSYTDHITACAASII